MAKFTITLKENDNSMGTYKINSRLFDTLKKYLEPYQSFQPKAKKIRCIESGEVFDCARDAGKWVEFVKEIYYCNFDLIKQTCKGKQKTSYGYHWEFVTSKDVI